MAGRPSGRSPAASGLREAILAEATQPRRGPPNWFDKLPADLAEEVGQIREDWRARTVSVTRWHLARLIARHLAERGVTTSQLAVDRWLAA